MLVADGNLKFINFSGNVWKTTRRHVHSSSLPYSFRERLLKAFSNAHTPFESRKQKSVEANTVRACDKINEDSSSWSKKYIWTRIENNLVWMNVFANSCSNGWEKLRGISESFEAKPQDWNFCVWFAVSNSDKDIHWFGVMLEDVPKLDIFEGTSLTTHWTAWNGEIS